MSDVIYGVAVGFVVGVVFLVWGVAMAVGRAALMRWFDRRYKPGADAHAHQVHIRIDRKEIARAVSEQADRGVSSDG